MENFLKKWDKLEPKTQSIIECAVGAVLALITGLFLFFSGGENSSYITTIIAIGIPLMIPNILERQSGRRFAKLRIAMLIVLTLIIVIMFISGMNSGKVAGK